VVPQENRVRQVLKWNGMFRQPAQTAKICDIPQRENEVMRKFRRRG